PEQNLADEDYFFASNNVRISCVDAALPPPLAPAPPRPPPPRPPGAGVAGVPAAAAAAAAASFEITPDASANSAGCSAGTPFKTSRGVLPDASAMSVRAP